MTNLATEIRDKVWNGIKLDVYYVYDVISGEVHDAVVVEVWREVRWEIRWELRDE